MAWGLVAEWLASNVNGPFGLAAAFVITGGGTAFHYLRSRREKMLSFRVRFNSRLGFDPPDAGTVVRLIDRHNNEIPQAGMVVARIKNVGRTSITDQDYVHPLGLTFPPNGDRQLVTVDVTEARPPDLQRLLTENGQLKIEDNRILLPTIHLNPGSEFKLVALLTHTTGTGRPEVTTNGILRNGRIFLDSDGRRLRRGTIIGGGISILLAGALVAVLLVNTGREPGGPISATCEAGTLTVSGSSAFEGAITTLAEQYMANCENATITVEAPGSVEGLVDLKGAPAEERPRRLALADGRFDDTEEFATLKVAASLAVVPYSFVVSPEVPIRDISRTELRKIFLGQTANWKDVQVPAGIEMPDRPVRIVGRDNRSGSRRVIEKTLLDAASQAQITSDTCDGRRPGVPETSAIICEVDSTAKVLTAVADHDDAIGYVDMPNAVTPESGVDQIKVSGHGATLEDIETGYPHWTVEYLYSYGSLTNTAPLTRSFVTYLVSPDSSTIIGKSRYSPCIFSTGQPQPLCDQGR